VSWDPDPQTPDEVAASVAAGSAASFALWIVEEASTGDIRAAWADMDDTLRLTRAQCWLANLDTAAGGYDRDELATALGARVPDHELADAFFEVEQGMWRQAWPRGLEGVGVLSRPRPVPPDMELVVLTDLSKPPAGVEALPDGNWRVDGPDEIEIPTFARMLVRYVPEEGWELVSHNGERLPVPGWPPML
jgi:hypothetical protein